MFLNKMLQLLMCYPRGFTEQRLWKPLTNTNVMVLFLNIIQPLSDELAAYGKSQRFRKKCTRCQYPSKTKIQSTTTYIIIFAFKIILRMVLY